jgi:GT2 family glycosyltransferase
MNNSMTNPMGRLLPGLHEAYVMVGKYNEMGCELTDDLDRKWLLNTYIINGQLPEGRGLLTYELYDGHIDGYDVLAFMEAHPKAGGAGVMMRNEDGSLAPESRRALPTPWVSCLKMIGFDKRYYMSHLPWEEPGKIEVISGAFCFLRRKALDEVGLLDEDFFMYGEDIDLSYRLLKGGWENWYLPYAITHYKGRSTQKTDYRYVHIFYQAMLIFLRKHYGHLSVFYTIPIKLAIYFRAAIALTDILRKKLHL